ncbi:MAG TPA: hypothetical protein VHN80_08835, partial [Kineosporiaceae bacterium]|nr:hypothetical protein [Kineosporiaceae bacterium]
PAAVTRQPFTLPRRVDARSRRRARILPEGEMARRPSTQQADGNRVTWRQVADWRLRLLPAFDQYGSWSLPAPASGSFSSR